jgi:hypothetical protein
VTLTHLQTVEPRYVIECFPAVLAFGALAWRIPWRQAATEHDALRAVPDVVNE